MLLGEKKVTWKPVVLRIYPGHEQAVLSEKEDLVHGSFVPVVKMLEMRVTFMVLRMLDEENGR